MVYSTAFGLVRQQFEGQPAPQFIPERFTRHALIDQHPIETTALHQPLHIQRKTHAVHRIRFEQGDELREPRRSFRSPVLLPRPDSDHQLGQQIHVLAGISRDGLQRIPDRQAAHVGKIVLVFIASRGKISCDA